MTTVSQGDLPKDPDVLRTIVQRNAGNVGVLASVLRGGRIRRGDAVVGGVIRSQEEVDRR